MRTFGHILYTSELLKNYVLYSSVNIFQFVSHFSEYFLLCTGNNVHLEQSAAYAQTHLTHQTLGARSLSQSTLLHRL